MIRRWPCLVAGFLLATSLHAQVTVEVKLEQEQYLAGEEIVAAVRITNFSGQPLRLGEEPSWLEFSVEAESSGAILNPRSAVPVVKPFEVQNSTITTRRVDLAPHYDLTKPGRYSVVALVRFRQWGTKMETQPVTFDIIKGTVLWEQEFGVPTASKEPRPPEVRKYALQQALHMQKMKLYARVSDASEHRVFATIALGPLTSFTFSHPERQIDRQSRLHVLYQTGARSFMYFLIEPDGKLATRQTYDYADSRPILGMNREGEVVVKGGQRRKMFDDLPAPPESADDLEMNSLISKPIQLPAPAAPPAATNKPAAKP